MCNYFHGRGSSHSDVEMSEEPKSASEFEFAEGNETCDIGHELVSSVCTSCPQQTHLFAPLPPYYFDSISWTLCDCCFISFY